MAFGNNRRIKRIQKGTALTERNRLSFVKVRAEDGHVVDAIVTDKVKKGDTGILTIMGGVGVPTILGFCFAVRNDSDYAEVQESLLEYTSYQETKRG